MAGQTLWGAERTAAMQAKPFLRWAGGKQKWLFNHAATLPRFEGHYYEPFLGGGSVFFHLTRTEMRPFQAWLGDVNQQLVRAYLEIRDAVEEVIDGTKSMAAAYSAASDKRHFYEEVRESFNDSLPKSSTPKFIFLNRTCWNGLWRTNTQGRFNVPFGAPKSDAVMPSPDELRAVSAALQNARIRASSWQNLVSAAGAGDFVFLDPPYFSDSSNKSQPKYGVDTFGYDQHKKLAEMLVALHGRGAQFMLTNSGEPEMVSLYRDLGLDVALVQVPRAINSKAEERGPVGELIVTNLAGDKISGTNSSGALLDLEMLRPNR